MIEWTETARRALDDYCARSKAVLEGTGADANEVIEDLRRHVDEEVRAARLSVVTEEDIRRILTRVGEPGAQLEQKPPAVPPVMEQRDGKKRPGWLFLFWAIVLPFGTLVFELVTGISAGVLFDPIPSWFHVLMVALVPAVNLWIWRAARHRDPRHVRLLGWLGGAAVGVCAYYCLLYIPFTPFAAIAVLYLGLGLIPLSPYFAFVATVYGCVVYNRRSDKAGSFDNVWGALVAFGILALLQVPLAVTYYGMARATSEETETRARGVRVLRTFGDEEQLLRSCYGLSRGELDFDLVRQMFGGGKKPSAEQSREIYFRVTGKPFNSVPAPPLYTRAGRWTAMDEEFVWDNALGGEAVAQRVKGLSLLSSRMDAVAEPDASLVYCEWTFEFKNTSRQPREARAQIALPPGAVVSRVTLWINGEEREAAFGGRSQVREAYKSVAVVQRRDPVLVTTCGPDRVLMQCFPVPAFDGVMKVRIGITAPLALETPDRGRFIWPRFLERNFGIASDFKHALWLESPERLTHGKATISPSQSGKRPFAIRESLPDTNFTSSVRITDIHRSPDKRVVWAPTENPAQIIRQTIQAVAPRAPSRVVMVVDGSDGMQSFAREISEALSNVPESSEVALFVASDDVGEFTNNPAKASAAVIRELQQRLQRAEFVGGQDNFPALEAAWDLAAAVDNGVVIWVHLPQAVLLSSESALRQRIERSGGFTHLYELQVRNGPDRIVEKLDGLAGVEHLTLISSVRTDLKGFFDRSTGKVQPFELVRERIDASQTVNGPQVSKHVERLWARDETLQLASRRKHADAASLAAGHQLVTPVSGAVVLETKQQYDQHGLTPADPSTVPVIPEPSTSALVGVGILVYWLRNRSKRKAERDP